MLFALDCPDCEAALWPAAPLTDTIGGLNTAQTRHDRHQIQYDQPGSTGRDWRTGWNIVYLVTQTFCRAELSENRYNVAVRACHIDSRRRRAIWQGFPHCTWFTWIGHRPCLGQALEVYVVPRRYQSPRAL